MTAYERELKRRIASGEKLEVTRRWFIETMAKVAPLRSELTPFEAKFFRSIEADFLQWERLRKLN